jgi:hypothetical protein
VKGHASFSAVFVLIRRASSSARRTLTFAAYSVSVRFFEILFYFALTKLILPGSRNVKRCNLSGDSCLFSKRRSLTTQIPLRRHGSRLFDAGICSVRSAARSLQVDDDLMMIYPKGREFTRISSYKFGTFFRPMTRLVADHAAQE